MSRTLLGALILAFFVANATPLGPASLSDIIHGYWKQPQLHRRNDHRQVDVKYATITQHVDNFNPLNEATYEQRYLFIDDHFHAGGPIYVIFNDFSPADDYLLEYSLVHEIARQAHGGVFLLENRFYGQSVPTADLSLENLKYLTVEQSLVDAANFVHHIKTVTPGAENSPVVVVGGSHGGSLAVWFRQKYPHLSVGAWASSAPLLALQNHQQYKENAGRSIRDLAGDRCFNVIEEGFRELEAMAIAGKTTELHSLLNVCKDYSIESEENIAMLFFVISEFFSSISIFRWLIPQVCNTLNLPITPAEAVARAIQSQSAGVCVPVNYDSLVESQRNIQIGSNYYGFRQSTYQACTQLGGFATSESPNQPFGSFYPLAYFTKLCTDIFGVEVANHAIAHENEDRFNVEHGGLNPSIRNALFTYGELDPMRSLGITHETDLNDGSMIIQVPNSGRSYEFIALPANSTSEIRGTQLQIIDAIRSWTD